MNNYGITAEEMGARLSASLGRCSHAKAAPVVLSTGEVVAAVCEACLMRLPASWGCDECAFTTARTFSGAVVAVWAEELCEAHR